MYHYISFNPFAGFLLAPIGFAAAQSIALGVLGAVMFGVCGFVFVISCCLANTAKVKVYLEALSVIREWVEINLNNKYQNELGIRWSISEERVVIGHGEHTRTETFTHIIVQCVDGAGGAVVIQQPQKQVVQEQQLQTQPVVYVDQNGNSVNPQQVKVVQVHNPNAVQSPEGAQPPPAYEPAEASAPQQQGHTNY